MAMWSGCLVSGAFVATVLAFGVAGAADLPAPPVAKARFQCDLGRTIDATFYADRVALRLGDGRTMTLPQARSASGARYANANETIVFWNKGNTAFITEGADGPETFSGCILVSSDVSDPNWLTFASSEFGFSLRYPFGYTVDAGYVYQGLGPGHDIPGVSFTVPGSMTTGTNLAADTRLSVESLPDEQSCTADKFLPQGASTPTTVTENGTEYSVAILSDAGAGNFYDTTVYAMTGTSPCRAVRTFIHSTNIANYPAGTVKEFDRAKLVAEFDAVRRTLVIGQ